MLLDGYRIFMLGMLMFSLGPAGCEFPSDPQVRRVSIVLKAEFLGDEAFTPNPVRVPLAGKIIWKNEDNISHSMCGGCEIRTLCLQVGTDRPGKALQEDLL